LWTDSYTGVSVENGVYSLVLGPGGSRPLEEIPFVDPLWLFVSIDGEPMSLPITLRSVPFALGVRGIQIIPYYDSSSGLAPPSIVGGFKDNSAEDGVMGATIGGGGDGENLNRVGGDFGTIGGGKANGAGFDHDIMSLAGEPEATVGGGADNNATGMASTICGGRNNRVAGDYGTIAGGDINLIGMPLDPTYLGRYATIGGGHFNAVLASYGTIGGGGRSVSSRPFGNVVYDFYATIGGGSDNTAGSDNSDQNDGAFSAIGGGYTNWASARYSSVGGGADNHASGQYATVAGGEENIASGDWAFVGGGSDNDASGQQATVGGGDENTASGKWATVGGGSNNIVEGKNATVSGGVFNRAAGRDAMVPGGHDNEATGASSFAAGRQAKALHNGSFVWADSSSTADFSSTGDNQFLVLAEGGVGIGTNVPSNQLSINGAVDIAGRLGIATDTPEAGLHINGANGAGGIRLESYSHDLLSMYATGEAGFVIDSYRYKDGRRLPVLLQPAGGNVGIGTSSPGFLLEVNGDAGKPGGGSWSVASDRRLKDVEKSFDRSLDAIQDLKPVVYRYKEDNEAGLPSDVSYVGLIAQNVETSIPEAVSSDDTGYLHLNNDPIIWTMLNAINELREENGQQREQIEELRREMEVLKGAF
jgi:hypothetical protein